ncbi:hypothetical protein AB0B89_07455 [Sphaerisporangium sp. NPDC049002]|uniref:beta-xylosidase family glycoside hydrolase n=1 Tax=Sphaerisporangium sp. NPDC049002 TaxID=3155392 RepID=UPI00340FCF08
MRLRGRPESLTEWTNPSLVARRQRHAHFAVHAAMEFTPSGGERAARRRLHRHLHLHVSLRRRPPKRQRRRLRLVRIPATAGLKPGDRHRIDDSR